MANSLVKTTTQSEAPLVVMDWHGTDLPPLVSVLITIDGIRGKGSSEIVSYKYSWDVRLDDGQFVTNGGIFSANKNVYLLLEQIVARISDSLKVMETNA